MYQVSVVVVRNVIFSSPKVGSGQWLLVTMEQNSQFLRITDITWSRSWLRLGLLFGSLSSLINSFMFRLVYQDQRLCSKDATPFHIQYQNSSERSFFMQFDVQCRILDHIIFDQDSFHFSQLLKIQRSQSILFPHHHKHLQWHHHHPLIR